MHIKQVVISGFKSYCLQTFDAFDNGINFVVGQNGSGKSNFFYAIEFVLSEEWSYLPPEVRLELFHKGTDPRVNTAYVEIIFDNSDHRIPIDRDEIYLRRVIGPKDDQFFLNMKKIPRSNVINLLESAGLSNSNPYYIVNNAQINQMATAPDSQRLKLLREMAGTRVYDERREKSLLILRESDEKVIQINEFLRTIEERLKTLEKEKEDLKEYQRADRSKHFLEVIIHETEHKEKKIKLEELEKLASDGVKKQLQCAVEVHDAQEIIWDTHRKSKEVYKEVLAAREQKDLVSTEHQRLLREKAKLDLTIMDLTNDIDEDNKSKKRDEQELERLRITIAEKEKELEAIKPKYEEMKKLEEECTRTLALNEQKRQDLYAKQGRGGQFTSKQARDKWIRQQLKSLNKHINDKKGHEVKLRNDWKRETKKLTELEKQLTETTADMEWRRTAINDHNRQYYESKKTLDQAQSARNEQLWKETTVTQNLSSVKEDLAKADEALRSIAGKVTAGNKLFHHIVESDVVGTKILKEISNQNLPGEVTFMPLNQLQVRDRSYPKGNNIIIMLENLKYDPKYDKAMKYIFGKTLICRDMEYAMAYSKTYNLDCVTLLGDQVSSKGFFTGISFDQSRTCSTCIEIQKTRSELMEQIKGLELELSTLRQELHKTEANINSTVSEMQKTETKQGKAEDVFDRVKANIRLIKEELSSIEKFRGRKERSLAQCRSSLEVMQATKEARKSELCQELMNQLSTADQGKVDELNDAIRRLNQENKEAFSARMNFEATKNNLENQLKNNLIRRKDELVQALQEISVEDRKRRLSNSKANVLATEKRIKAIAKDLKDADNKERNAVKEEENLKTDSEMWKKKEKEAYDEMDEFTKDLEKMAFKEVVIQQDVRESLDKITALGSLPNAPDLHTQYQNMSLTDLFRELEKANQLLKNYNAVNKNALDQFLSFSEQNEKLIARKKEIDISVANIRQLIDTLEHRKLVAIEFTFRQVSKNFTDVFKKLVPQGRGSLVMRMANEDGDKIGPEHPNVEQFIGVGIKVSFTGDNATMMDMNQLSGGQKSLVALAFIFAIQKCDPAPFYLFDTIDQALDQRHRKAIADMIHELSSSAQFIIITFRPELLDHAHKFYHIKFRNEVSHVECVTREEARDFVENSTTQG